MPTEPTGPVLDTSTAPDRARKVANLKPDLLLSQEHHMCPGCGEPLALRVYLEALQELGLTQRSIMVAGIGCYTAFTSTVDVDLVQALHRTRSCSRSRATATW
jgi:2-oxoglutarate ferredoxin oxidoreductase subunit beta